MAENMVFFDPDRPLDNPAKDQLGYAPFAKQLAESLVAMAPPEGAVISIYGPWGSGKSTALNFLTHYLRGYPEEQRPILVTFNPWWFSGQEELVRRFFAELATIVGAALGDKVRKGIADFAELVALLPSNYSGIANVAARLIRPARSVMEEKKRLTKLLKEQPRRIVIVIDDIDRLVADEIRQIFRLVKAVADFPNTTYLLAFDKNVVAKALSEFHQLPGEAYLEKIIQVPFELPNPGKADLRSMFFRMLDRIFVGTPDNLFNPVRWGNVFLRGIDPFLETPRHVHRLINTLNVTYPALRGEVNSVDFIGIETLRVFSADVYDLVRNNQERLAGSASSSSAYERQLSKEAATYEQFLNAAPEQHTSAVKSLLTELFPKLEAVWGGSSYGASWLSQWRRDLRVCSPDMFRTYFQLAVGQGRITAAEMNAILALAGSSDAFAKELLKLAGQKRRDGRTRVSEFLDRLEDHTEDAIEIAYIPSIITALFRIGDLLLLPEDKPNEMFGFGNGLRMMRIRAQLMVRISPTDRFEILKAAILPSNNVSTIVSEVAVIAQEHEKTSSREPRPETERTVNSEELAKLEKLALDKIRHSVGEHALLDTPELAHTLYRWRDWAGEDEVREWVASAIATDDGLIRFIEHFGHKTFSQGIGNAVGQVHYRLDPKSLAPFMSPSTVIERVRGIVATASISSEQRQALNQFAKEYDLRAQGKDPERERS